MTVRGLINERFKQTLERAVEGDFIGKKLLRYVIINAGMMRTLERCFNARFVERNFKMFTKDQLT